jgi:pyruvate/2-oxoglutarate dehydrogenase complex dihydrolipoamide acyltransferase (E2) component
MSPKLSRGAASGSGPGGRVEVADIQAKLEEIRGDTTETAARAKPAIIAGAVAGAVVLVGIAFLLGRRRGRRKSTWVEVRRL